MVTTVTRSKPTLPVETGSVDQAKKMIACLEEAFQRVPFHISTIEYICGGSYNQEVSQLLFEDAIEDAFKNGVIYTMDDCNAVSLWFKPGKHHDAINTEKWLAHIGKAGLERFESFGKVMSQNQKQVVGKRDVWYLYMIVSNQAGRGKRLASTLLRHSLAQIDRDGKPCYLECVDPSLVTFYQKFGFKPIKTLEVRPNVPVTLMLREPQPIELPSSL